MPEKWDPGPGTPKYLSRTPDFQFSIVLIVYSTLNTLHFTCYKTLQYTEATITMCYKIQRILSSYLNFSEILEKNLYRSSNLSSEVEDFKHVTS